MMDQGVINLQGIESLYQIPTYSKLFNSRVKGPLIADLAQREPDNLMGLMDKVDDCINQEETL